MNCSKRTKKNSIGVRILISWAIVAVLFSLITGLIVWGAMRHSNNETTHTETHVMIYGKLDGKIVDADIPTDWEAGLEFTPVDGCPLDTNIQEFIYYLSAAYDIDYSFAMALIQQESGYDPEKISDTGDYGLMQVNSINFDELESALGITDFLDPYDNIRAGMYMIRNLFDKYETPAKVCMAYNIGEYGAAELWEQGVFETNYSRSVLQAQQQINDTLERSLDNDNV